MLTEALVRKTLLSLMQRISPIASKIEYRMVGTSTMLLRGVNLPANDIDILFKERQGIDLFHRELLASSAIEHLHSPSWLEGAGQYFARYAIDGAVVELSTVEFKVDAGNDTLECVGRGPWEHFDLVPCGPFHIPVVAVELRLLTELSRDRAERYQPILAYLRTRPCDLELIKRGLAALNISQARQQLVLESLERTQ